VAANASPDRGATVKQLRRERGRGSGSGFAAGSRNATAKTTPDPAPGRSFEYFLVAVSSDGKHFIWITGQLERRAALPGLTPLSAAEVERLDDQAFRESYQQQVKAAIAAAQAGSFEPDFAQLDAAARSLELH